MADLHHAGRGPGRHHTGRPPLIHPTWRAEFIKTLRQRNVEAPLIAEHLKEIETHLAETGEPVGVAFGGPREYALSLGLSGRWFAPWQLAWPSCSTALWMLFMSRTYEPGPYAELTLGATLAWTTIVLMSCAAIVVNVRSPRGSQGMVLATFAVGLAVVMVCLWQFEQVVLALSRPAWLASMAVVLAAGLALLLVGRRRHALVDPVTGVPMRVSWSDWLRSG